MGTERLSEPERDAEIERQLFGREVVDDPDSCRGVSVLWPDGRSRELPRYHRDIAAAWHFSPRPPAPARRVLTAADHRPILS